MPPCDQTGTPRHFHSSTTSGSACLMRARTRASVLPRQSSSSLMRASISLEGSCPVAVFVVFFAAFFFTVFFVTFFFVTFFFDAVFFAALLFAFFISTSLHPHNLSAIIAPLPPREYIFIVSTL